ncbi:MAG TPA: hypothetical protein VGN57_22100 [Pirellulaceae bacterium]|jgi:hypothetical protein|nr:hypothetical protein [Pirellulaceae bacterium]
MSHSAADSPWYDDVDVPTLVTVGIVGGAITVATLFACLGVYNLYKGYDIRAKAAAFDESESSVRLQVQEEALTRYAVVDAAKNQYQVPITEAMRSVVDEYERPLER